MLSQLSLGDHLSWTLPLLGRDPGYRDVLLSLIQNGSSPALAIELLTNEGTEVGLGHDYVMSLMRSSMVTVHTAEAESELLQGSFVMPFQLAQENDSAAQDGIIEEM